MKAKSKRQTERQKLEKIGVEKLDEKLDYFLEGRFRVGVSDFVAGKDLIESVTIKLGFYNHKGQLEEAIEIALCSK